MFGISNRKIEKNISMPKIIKRKYPDYSAYNKKEIRTC